MIKGANRKVAGVVNGIPREAWVCGTVIVVLEIIALTVNIDLNRPTDSLLGFLGTINSVLVAMGGILFKLDKTSAPLDAIQGNTEKMLNGAMDQKLIDVLGEQLPGLVGAVLDARGFPAPSSVPAVPGVASGHDSTPNPTQPPTHG